MGASLRKDDWDRHLPLTVFAINNAASSLGDGLTPFFIDRGAHPRHLPFSAAPVDGAGGESPALYARWMRTIQLTVHELLAAAQQASKMKLVAAAGRRDTVFKVGDRVLLRTKELLDAADIGKLRPRWDGPFTVTGCPSPNAYKLALPQRCSPAQALPRAYRLSTGSGPGVGRDPGQEGEHEAAQPQDDAGRHTRPRAVARTHRRG